MLLLRERRSDPFAGESIERPHQHYVHFAAGGRGEQSLELRAVGMLGRLVVDEL